MESAKVRLFEYLNNLLKNYPDINIEKVRSLTKLTSDFNVGKGTLLKWVNNYLSQNYNDHLAKEIKQRLWPNRSIVSNQIKKEKLFQILDFQLNHHYPNNLKNIYSLNDFKKKIGVRRETITKWTNQFLKQKYGLSLGKLIFNDIWTNRKQSKHIIISYNYLKIFAEKRKAFLITSEEEFNNMKEVPTSRYIKIKCIKGHGFEPSVLHLIYHNQWCPRCNIHFCQKIMGMYMEVIFNKPFPETTLKKAYGISSSEGGQLRFDGYNNKVLIKGRWFKIAFEYDGIQHDKFPNPFHDDLKDFKIQKQRDRKKVSIAQKFNTIIIRLKDVDGFNSNSIHLFQNEIIKQFRKATGINIQYMHILIYDTYNDCLKEKNDNIDKWLISIQKDRRSEEIDKSKIEESNEKDSIDVRKEQKKKKISNSDYPNSFEAYPISHNINDKINEYMWLSPQVREEIESRIKFLIQKIRKSTRRMNDQIENDETDHYTENDKNRIDIEAEVKNIGLKEITINNYEEEEKEFEVLTENFEEENEKESDKKYEDIEEEHREEIELGIEEIKEEIEEETIDYLNLENEDIEEEIEEEYEREIENLYEEEEEIIPDTEYSEEKIEERPDIDTEESYIDNLDSIENELNEELNESREEPEEKKNLEEDVSSKESEEGEGELIENKQDEIDTNNFEELDDIDGIEADDLDEKNDKIIDDQENDKLIDDQEKDNKEQERELEPAIEGIDEEKSGGDLGQEWENDDAGAPIEEIVSILQVYNDCPNDGYNDCPNDGMC